MEELCCIIRSAGSWPACINRCRNWTDFGDALWKDLKSVHGLKVNKRLHDAKKEGGGVVRLWKKEFPQSAYALDNIFRNGSQSGSPGGAFSSFNQQPIVYVPVPGYFYNNNGYGHYGQTSYGHSWVGGQRAVIKDSSSSSSFSEDEKDNVVFGEFGSKPGYPAVGERAEEKAKNISQDEAKQIARPKSLALESRKRRWHDEEYDDICSVEESKSIQKQLSRLLNRRVVLNRREMISKTSG